MSNLYSIIKSVQAAQGSNAKKAILEANKDNELLQEYLKAVYDPAISYYQTSVKKSEAPTVLCFDFTQGLLEGLVYHLAQRALTGKQAEKWLTRLHNGASVESKVLIELLIKRSIGAGIGDTMILKVWPNLYFIPPYQRCSLMTPKIKQKFEKLNRIFVQEKLDGSFCYAVTWLDGCKQAITRAGNSYPSNSPPLFSCPLGDEASRVNGGDEDDLLSLDLCSRVRVPFVGFTNLGHHVFSG